MSVYADWLAAIAADSPTSWWKLNETTGLTDPSDSFTRANSTSTLGKTDQGQIWVPVTGTWGISSNQAYTSVATSSGEGSLAGFDHGYADGSVAVTLVAAPATNQQGGVWFRSGGTNDGWVAYIWQPSVGSTQFRLDEFAGSTLFTRLFVNSAFSFPARIVATFSGTTISVTVNGVSMGSFTSSAHQTGTFHGLNIWNSTAVRLDDYATTGMPVLVAADDGSANNDGLLVGGFTIGQDGWTLDSPNKAVHLAGSNDGGYLEADPALFGTPTSFTFEAIVRVADYTTAAWLISDSQLEGETDGFEVDITAGILGAAVTRTMGPGQAFAVAGTTEIPLDTWTHVAAVFDDDGSAQTLKVFVNGCLDGEGSTTGHSLVYSANRRFLLGRQVKTFGLSGRWLVGDYDEAVLWDSALSDTQIRTHANAALLRGPCFGPAPPLQLRHRPDDAITGSPLLPRFHGTVQRTAGLAGGNPY